MDYVYKNMLNDCNMYNIWLKINSAEMSVMSYISIIDFGVYVWQ